MSYFAARKATSIAVFRINVHEAGGRVQNTPVTDGSEVGALLEAHPQLLGVVVDPGASANHGLVVAAHVPGKAQGRREVVGVVFRRAQVAPIEGRKILGLGEVKIEQRAFVLPGQTVIDREVWPQLPGVLEVEAIAIVHSGVLHVVRRRLAWVAQPDLSPGYGEAQQVSVRRDGGREIKKRQVRRRNHAGDELGRKDHAARRIAIAPETRARRALKFGSKAKTMRALLPGQAVLERITAQVAPLCGVRRVADLEVVGAYHGEIRKAEPEASRAVLLPRKQIAVLPVGIAEVKIVD